MKKILLSLMFLVVFIIANNYVNASAGIFIQDTVQVNLEDLEVEDSVSIDDMEPIFYEAEDEDTIVEVEDSGKSNFLIYLVIGIVVIGGAAVLYSRSKKK